MKDCCLIVIFNHRYDKNICKIRDMYAERFSDIYIVMPFYDGEQVDGVTIIPVYESSWQFHGYISQAYLHITEKYKHYIILGDDLILNPNLNEDNIKEYLRLEEADSYIKGFLTICESCEVAGGRLYKEVLSPFFYKNGTEWKGLILDKEDAEKVLASKNIAYDVAPKISWIIRGTGNNKTIKRTMNMVVRRAIWGILCVILCLRKSKKLKFPYPLFKGYSDFLVFSGKDMDRCCQMMGVFAAMGLFVEYAIPTVMAICCENIVWEKDTKRRGIEFWTASEKKNFTEKYSSSLSELFMNWDDDVIYYHPVKLSMWKD